MWVAENGQRRAGLQHLPSLHNSPLEKKSMFCRDDQCDGGSDHYDDGVQLSNTFLIFTTHR